MIRPVGPVDVTFPREVLTPRAVSPPSPQTTTTSCLEPTSRSGRSRPGRPRWRWECPWGETTRPPKRVPGRDPGFPVHPNYRSPWGYEAPKSEVSGFYPIRYISSEQFNQTVSLEDPNFKEDN